MRKPGHGDPGTPSLKNAVELISESELALEFEFAEASTTAVSSAPHAFRLLSDTEFGLRKVFDSLKRSRNYRPIVHLAWRQPGYDKAHARPAHLLVPFKQPEDAPVPTIDREPKLEGTVRLYRERYLHVEADLLYNLTGITSTIALRRGPGTPLVVEELIAAEKHRPGCIPDAQPAPHALDGTALP